VAQCITGRAVLRLSLKIGNMPINSSPNDSGTILPDGRRSQRSSPPPLYPEPGGQPLPNRVDETDMNATSVTPAALNIPSRRRPPGNPPPPRRAPAFNWRSGWGCFLRGLVVSMFLLAALLIIAAVAAVMAYYSIASTLPSVSDLQQRSAKFETTRILDRNGNILFEILDPSAGRRTYVKIDQISPFLVAATIATEDKDFYSHPGFDPVAILRAVWENLTTGGNGTGASTITQQLARALLLSPEERVERSYMRKIREIILAAEITRLYPKDEILELYLNEIYYGNLAYGIEAAAETYFGPAIDGQLTGAPNGHLADDLNLAQASFLAGLPQSPSVYDIHTNRDATLNRQKNVLVLMYQLSAEKTCIKVSNSPQPVCVGVDEALGAAKAIEDFTFPTPNIQMRYPHWVQFVRSQLESMFDAQTIYRSGFTVYTTLDPGLQDAAQQIVTSQVATLMDKNATDGALVAIKPATGEILAMVGSVDFYNEAIHGQVNMATSPTRQPGSSIKPLTYVAAFEKGWTPSTLIWDVPSEFPPSGDPNDPREPYVPVNYDGKFHGPVTVRTALSNSYNIPAVKALQYVGIYDDPNTPAAEGLIGMAHKLGITSLTRDDYGLALTLGGGDVSLLEMTGAYAVFANAGKRIPPVAILRITDNTGAIVYDYKAPAGEQVIRAEHAYLLSSILSDYVARRPMFGNNPVINLPFPAAAKTGTTNDFRDNWTMGYTPDLAVGVWVGNADYTPMQNTTGLTGAAPIWAEFMQQAIARLSGAPTAFQRPSGVVDEVICAISGTKPSEWCPEQRSEIYAADQPPLPATEDLWKEAIINTWTGLLAAPACDDFVEKKLVLNVTDQFARRWLRKDDTGRAWAKEMGFDRPIFFVPDGKCDVNSPKADLKILDPQEDAVLKDEKVDIRVLATASTAFETWRLEFAPGNDPAEDANWQVLYETNAQIPIPDVVFTWKLREADNGRVTLRLRMENKEGGYAQRLVHLKLDFTPPTPIPTAEPPTDTPPPTAIPPTRTPRPPTDTPVPPTAIPPTETPIPSPTDTPVPPTDTPVPPTETPTP
jgi:membrane peptidoglycan carboxypeptidase